MVFSLWGNQKNRRFYHHPLLLKVLSKLTMTCIRFLANQKIKTAQKGRKHWLDAFWRIKRKKSTMYLMKIALSYYSVTKMSLHPLLEYLHDVWDIWPLIIPHSTLGILLFYHLMTSDRERSRTFGTPQWHISQQFFKSTIFSPPYIIQLFVWGTY